MEKFDVVILDPPAFIKKKKDFHRGSAAYKKINEMGLRLLNPGGILVSASCSMHMPEADLQAVVQKAGRHIDRELSLFYRGGHALDHPIHPAIKETDYLKAQFYILR
jgi:23S rRNA (cytosine1962-C5)-methyltransferase